GQQQSVDDAVADAAPEHLEREIRAVWPGCGVAVDEDVSPEGYRRDDADSDAPRPVARERVTKVDSLDARVRTQQRKRHAEVQKVERVVLEVEHRQSNVGDQEGDETAEREPTDMAAGSRYRHGGAGLGVRWHWRAIGGGQGPPHR